MLFSKEDVNRARRRYRKIKKLWPVPAGYTKDHAGARLIKRCNEGRRLIEEILRTHSFLFYRQSAGIFV